MIYRSQLYLFLEFYQRFKPEITTIKKPKILDCAAGGQKPPLGLFYENGFETWGIDFSAEALEQARLFEKAHGMELNLQYGDMRQLPFEDQLFDAVYEFYSMVHLDHADIARTLLEMRRVLKPGGLCFAGFMSVDTWPIEGEQVQPGEYALLEDGKKVIHSVFTDAEIDPYLAGWKVLLMEKRLSGMQARMAQISEVEWVAKYPEMQTQYSQQEWIELYAGRIHHSRYAHTFVILQKPEDNNRI